MAEPPKQKCDLSREELKDDGKKLGDFCPLCKKLGVEVEIGFHKSRDAPPGQSCLTVDSCCPVEGRGWQSACADVLFCACPSSAVYDSFVPSS